MNPIRVLTCFHVTQVPTFFHVFRLEFGMNSSPHKPSFHLPKMIWWKEILVVTPSSPPSYQFNSPLSTEFFLRQSQVSPLCRHIHGRQTKGERFWTGRRRLLWLKFSVFFRSPSRRTALWKRPRPLPTDLLNVYERDYPYMPNDTDTTSSITRVSQGLDTRNFTWRD